MGSLRLILGLASALVVVSFGVINMQPVSVTFYQGTFRLPLFYILLGFFACGFLLAWLGGLFDRLRFHRQVRGLRQQVRSLETELARAREQGDRLLAAPPSDPAGEPSSPLPACTPQASAPPSGPAPGPGSPKEEGRDVPSS